MAVSVHSHLSHIKLLNDRTQLDTTKEYNRNEIYDTVKACCIQWYGTFGEPNKSTHTI